LDPPLAVNQGRPRRDRPYRSKIQNPKSKINNQQSTINNQQSTINNHQSSIINHQSSIINHQSSIINHQSLPLRFIIGRESGTTAAGSSLP